MVLSNIQQINKYLKEIGDIIRLKEDYIDPNSPFNFLDIKDIKDIKDINDETLNVDYIKPDLTGTALTTELDRVKLILGLPLSATETNIGTALGNSSLTSYTTLNKKVIIHTNDKNISEATLFQKILFKNIGNIANGYLYDTFITTNTCKYYQFLLEALISLYNNPDVSNTYTTLKIKDNKLLLINSTEFKTIIERKYPPDTITIELIKEMYNIFKFTITNDEYKYGEGEYKIYYSTIYGGIVPGAENLFDNVLNGSNNNNEIWGAHFAINQYMNNGYYTGTYNNFFGNNNRFNNGGDWVVIQLPIAIYLSGIYLLARTNSSTQGRAPGLWRFYGSNDKVNWTIIPEASNEETIAPYNNSYYEKKFNSLNNKYLYFGLIVNKLVSNSEVTLNFQEFKLYGHSDREIDKIPITLNTSSTGFSDYPIENNINLPTKIFDIIREHYIYIKSNTYTNNDTTYNKAAILKLYKLALYNLNNIKNYYDIPYPYITLNPTNYNNIVSSDSIQNINTDNIIFGSPNKVNYNNTSNENIHIFAPIYVSSSSPILAGSYLGNKSGTTKAIANNIEGVYFKYKSGYKIIINKLEVKALGWTLLNAPYEVKIFAKNNSDTNYTSFNDANTTNNLNNYANNISFIEFNIYSIAYDEYLFIFTKTGGDSFPNDNGWWDISWKGHMIIKEMKLYTSFGTGIGNITDLFKYFNDIDLQYAPTDEYKNLEINNKNQIDVENSISKLSKRNTKYKNMNNLDKDKIVNITYLEIYCIVILVFTFITGTVLLMSNSMDVSSTYITSIFILIVAIISFYIIITNNLINKNTFETFDNDEVNNITIHNYEKDFLFKAFENILRGLTLNRYIYIAKYRFYKNHRDKKNDLKRLEIEYSRNKNNTNNTQIEYYKKKNIVLFITFLTLLIAVSIFLCIVLPSIKLYILIISVIIFFILICYLYYSIISVSNNDYSKNYNNLLTSKIYKL